MSDMQVDSLDYPGFKLPTVIDPPDSLCFQINVPNDEGHIAAFFGAIFELSQWISWQRDVDKRGKDAAAVWRKIYLHLKAQECAVPIIAHGVEQEDFMPLRVDCNCNVFVTCCDGTEKQILTADQVKALINSPGNGTPQPPAGGGRECYHLILNANAPSLIPTPVSTGDIIDLQNVVGAHSNSFNLDWLCPDGSIFFAGTCAGAGFTEGTNPLPAAKTGRVIVNIGGTFYDGMAGPITVPSGVSNVQPTVQVNDAALTGLAGQLQLDACVTNNQALTFTHTFNFLTTDGGFVAQPNGNGYNMGTWVPGQGWHVTDDVSSGGHYFRRVVIAKDFTPGQTLNSLDMGFDLTIGAHHTPTDVCQEIAIGNPPPSYPFDQQVLFSAATSANGQHFPHVQQVTGSTQLYLALVCSDDPTSIGNLDGDAYIKSLTVTGNGADPF